jgi:D-alanine--poly(phosphoribitol) ligase subunit 1
MYNYNLAIRFEKTVSQHGDRRAIMFSRRYVVSYDDLNRKANRIGRYLRELGVGGNDVVCLAGDKTVSTFAGMLACLKIGAIYAVVDSQSPVERLRRILTTCGPKVLFVGKELGLRVSRICEELRVETISNEPRELDNRTQVFADTNLAETKQVTGSNPAYIMFTSGSTGFPKGAVMTHSNVLNFIEWSLEEYKISSDEILTNVNPLYFDNSVFDFYSALFSGACIVPVSKDTVKDPKALVSSIDELQCTSWFSVPTLLMFLQTMKALNQGNMKSIRRFIFGGEGYPKAKLKELYDLYGRRANLFNVYGPTECTCICSSYEITSSDFSDLGGLPPLGKMIPNFSCLILDENGSAASDGEVGELCLLGPNVGKGYYNDLEKTHTSFVQNPFNDKYSDIMYKTGDLVKYNRDDDKIYVMGRKDNQIKHMGYRIELEEIEAALCRLDYISQAVALHGNTRGLSQIIAVVSSEGKVDEKHVRQDLRQLLPDYMIPSKFHVEKQLPRNPNGKVDRKRLAEIHIRSDGK